MRICIVEGHDLEFLIFRTQTQSKESAVIDGSHRAAVEWALRQSIPRSPQVSLPQGKALYTTLLLAMFDAGHLHLSPPCRIGGGAGFGPFKHR